MRYTFIRLLFLPSLMLPSFLAYGQPKDSASNIIKSAHPKENKYFIVAEVEPEFPDGQNAIYKFISSNLNYLVYPVKKKSRVEFIVTFIIEKDGSITNPSFEGDNRYDVIKEELIEVINIMPKWKPASQNGREVRFRYVLPLYIELDK